LAHRVISLRCGILVANDADGSSALTNSMQNSDRRGIASLTAFRRTTPIPSRLSRIDQISFLMAEI
jgi:hypothetical protein